MTFDEIRTKLSRLEGKKYWRSLEELADTPEFNDLLHREFPARASEFTDPQGRRDFLRIMGASLALAGISSCTRMPEENILPYVRQPEEIVPGRPLYFATAMPQGGVAVPLLAENHMGRPTHMAGNPEHPASLGSVEVFSQASVLGLYDPDRSKSILYRGDPRTWADFTEAMYGVANAQKAIKGQTLRFLTEPISSPSLLDQIEHKNFATDSGNLVGNGLPVAGVHGSVVGAGGERNGLRELIDDLPQRGIGHLQLAGHEIG